MPVVLAIILIEFKNNRLSFVLPKKTSYIHSSTNLCEIIFNYIKEFYFIKFSRVIFCTFLLLLKQKNLIVNDCHLFSLIRKQPSRIKFKGIKSRLVIFCAISVVFKTK